MLKGKKIVLGVTASIAAYKAAFLVRLLIKEGAEVRVILTPAAKDFVTPLTLSTLSKNPAEYEFVNDLESGEWTNHVDLGLWGDLMLIAPATANTMSKMVSGACDNLLMAVYLSAKCPVYMAPAMDLDMYKHPATKKSLDTLEANGVEIIPAATGELASGLEGEGRMAEPEDIVSFLKDALAKKQPLYGKTVVVNAGPTYENIDDVRFIGNYSTGKMGVAMAREATQLGATVHLVLGPTEVPFDFTGMQVHHVVSAQEMFEETSKWFDKADIGVLSAAVADYRPKNRADGKIKKSEAQLTITLERTTDILASLGASKRKSQTLVGFALESVNEETYAEQKLKNKKADFIVLNSLRDEGAGFGKDSNKVKIFSNNSSVSESDTLPKSEIAQFIWTTILK